MCLRSRDRSLVFNITNIKDILFLYNILQNPTYYYNKRNMEAEDKIRRKILKKKEETILKPLDEGIALVKAGGGFCWF